MFQIPDATSPLQCVRIKGSFNFNLYSAMGGYDVFRSNPYDHNGDPGIRSRIFLQDCYKGYYDFVSDVRVDMQCDASFTTKTIKSLEEYDKERESSTSFSDEKGAEAGKTRVSVQGVESLWGDCRFIPADWGS